MQPPTYDAVAQLLTDRGYPLFTGGKAPNLTLVLLRSLPGKPNSYDDLLCALYEGKIEAFRCTADPGLFYLNNPMRPTGTAVLAHDQHIKAAFQMGTHKGIYPCLTQTRPLPVWRDANKDGVVDYGGKLYTDSQGIQIHAGGKLENNVGKYSAGCVALRLEDWPRFIQLAQRSIQANGPTLSLSIIGVPS
jgi:hypothetical protein